MPDSIVVSYDISSEGMDSYQTARAIASFGRFVEVASRENLGQSASVQTNVRGISDGSLEIEFLLLVAAGATRLLEVQPSLDLALANGIREALTVFRWLKGSAPSDFDDQGDTVSIKNIEGDSIVIQNSTINIINSLSNGAESVKMVHSAIGEFIRVERDEAEYFRPLDTTPEILEDEIRMSLIITTINFGEGNKWRFRSGSTYLWADIADEEYRERIQNGHVRFGKGDTLVARVRVVQERGARGALVPKHSITKIEQHSIAPQQGALL